MASKSIDWDSVLVTQDPKKKEVVISFPGDGFGFYGSLKSGLGGADPGAPAEPIEPPLPEPEPVPPVEPLPECVSHSCSAFIDYMTENNYLAPYFYRGFSGNSLDLTAISTVIDNVAYIENERGIPTQYSRGVIGSTQRADVDYGIYGAGIIDSASGPCTEETYYGAPIGSPLFRNGPTLDMGYHINGPKYAAGDDVTVTTDYVKNRSYSMSNSYAFILNCKNRNGDLIEEIKFQYGGSSERISTSNGAGATSSFSSTLRNYTYYPQTGICLANRNDAIQQLPYEFYMGKPDDDGFIFISVSLERYVVWGLIENSEFYIRANENATATITARGSSYSKKVLNTSVKFGDGTVTVGKILTNDYAPGGYVNYFSTNIYNNQTLYGADFRIAVLWLAEAPSSAAYIAFKKSFKSYAQPTYCEALP